jgi:integrase
MTVLSGLDAAGRRRSPATLPGYHAGRPPRNKGMRFPADPPTIDEIVAVMRHTSNDRHGRRVRAMIVVLWRAGLRVQEALALAEHDLDHRHGSIPDPQRQGRPPTRGRDGRVGLGAAAAVAARAPGAARRAAVLHHRRSDPRATVVCRRSPRPAPPHRRPRALGAGSRRTSCVTRTHWSSPARACPSTSSSANSGTPTSARPRSTSRESIPRRSSPRYAPAARR